MLKVVKSLSAMLTTVLLAATMLTTALAEDDALLEDTVERPTECEHNGQMIPEGPLPTDACCSCSRGHILCASVRCDTPCVDAVRDPKHCCPVCPNGPNCRGPDGETMQDGEEVKVDDSSTVKCQGGHLLHRYVPNDAPEFHLPEAPVLTLHEAPELTDVEAP